MASNTYLGTYYFIAVIIAVIMAIVFCDVLVSTKPDDDNTLIKRTPKKEDEAEDEDNPENDDIYDLVGFHDVRSTISYREKNIKLPKNIEKQIQELDFNLNILLHDNLNNSYTA